jgi:16S rRNA (guanine966-N2)-methyltransferase
MARGRPLRAPRGRATRPTSDRVREAVFDMLSAMDALEGASVLDLFAGSGALGIECLSRGADTAVMVDDAPEAIAAIRQNVAVLGPGEARVTVVRADVLVYLAGAPPFDLVLADPPYGYGRWADLLERLTGRTGLLVAETGAEKAGSLWSPGPGWETVKVKRYGSTVVSIARPAGARPEGAPSEGDS